MSKFFMKFLKVGVAGVGVFVAGWQLSKLFHCDYDENCDGGFMYECSRHDDYSATE